MKQLLATGQIEVQLNSGNFAHIQLFDVRVFEAMRENDSVLFATIPAEYHDNGRMFKGAYSVKIRNYAIL